MKGKEYAKTLASEKAVWKLALLNNGMIEADAEKQ